MATLVKDRKWYYVQFYDASKKPQRKRVSLKTTHKSTALKLYHNLERKHVLEQYDPWSGFDATASDLPLSKNSKLGDVLTFYITQKSREDWRDKTLRILPTCFEHLSV
jgi:CO dehydrogenase/acetyl-CoA synthase alpha subunit